MISALPRVAIAVRDFDAALAMFGDGFGMPVLDFSAQTVPDLGAHVAMCMPRGGSNIELMAVADPEAPLSMSLSKFLDRRGEGLFALMLEAPDPNAEAEALTARGLDVMALMPGAGGRDIHPKATHGVLIRVYPDGSVTDPGGHDYGALDLSGIQRAVIATADAAKAADVYGQGLGLRSDDPTTDESRGVMSVLVHPPQGATIELVSPIDTSQDFAADVARCVAATGGGLYALALHSADPSSAATQLQSRGLDISSEGSAGAFVVRAFGTRLIIE